MAPPGAPGKPSQVNWTPLLQQRVCLDVWSPNRGVGSPAPESVWLLPVPEAVSFCSSHSHLHRLVSEGSGNQDISTRSSGKALLGRVDTSPLARKVPGCLEPKKGFVSEAVL